MHFIDFQIFPIPEAEQMLASSSGNNQKKLLIVHKRLKPDQKEALLQLLENILKAIKLDLQRDILRIELEEHSAFSFSNLKAKTNIEKMLVFGVSPKSCGLNFLVNLYEPKNFGSWSFLFANDLAQIAENKNQKTRLWQALQTMFLNA